MSSPLVTNLLDLSLTQSSGRKRNLQLKIRKPSDQILSLNLAANNLLEKSVFRGMWNLGKPATAYTSLPCRSYAPIVTLSVQTVIFLQILFLMNFFT